MGWLLYGAGHGIASGILLVALAKSVARALDRTADEMIKRVMGEGDA